MRESYMTAKKEERQYRPSGSASVTKKKEHEFSLFEIMTFLDDLSEPLRYDVQILQEILTIQQIHTFRLFRIQS